MMTIQKFRGNILNLTSAARFTIEFLVETGISEEYQLYLKSHTTKIKVNVARKTIAIWFVVPEQGPIMELTEWFSRNTVSLSIREHSAQGEETRILLFDHCKVTDSELVYDYSDKGVLVNYTEWSYGSAEL